MSSLEDIFSSWAQGPGKTEAEKCENAESAVRRAIATDNVLSRLDATVFAQGSYRARTNVKQDSDVDICVRLNEVFFAEYPDGKAHGNFGNIDGCLQFPDFKNMVERALRSHFGSSSVTRGNKAFDVHANTYRVDADVVPTFEHRRYTGQNNADGSHYYVSGVEFLPDTGEVRMEFKKEELSEEFPGLLGPHPVSGRTQ